MPLQKIHGIIALPLLASLMGCAGSAPGEGKNATAAGTASPLETIKPGLRAPEDSLVLDLLIGYQMLLENTKNTDALDRQTLRQARNARNQLEYMLRYGGIVNRGHEGRVYSLPDGAKVTLQELVDQMSRSLLHYEESDPWKPETERAREIQRHKPELSSLVEDANWILTLTAALEDSLPGDVKTQLRQLHESYAKGVSHDEIAAKVNDLLPKVKDEHLRKEMKKLANRSWERDKHNTVERASAYGVTPEQKSDSIVTPIARANGHPPQQQSDSSVASDSKNAKDRVDSLASHGEYLLALRVLESAEGQPGTDWVQERRLSLGNRYCEDRRTAAAATFIAAHKTSNNSLKNQYLRQSRSALHSCQFQFPDSPVATKVRRNRALVEKELGR